MAQVVLYAQTAVMNWDAVNGWDTQADGLGTDYTNPQNGGGTTYACDLNGKAVTMNVNVVIDALNKSSGNLTVDPGTFSLTLATSTSTFSGTSPILVGNLVNFTLITNGNYYTNNGTGYGINVSGTGTVTINEPGTTIFVNTSSGRGIYLGGSGTSNITGNWTQSGSGNGILIGGAGTNNITGDPYVSGTGTGLNPNASGSTTNFSGMPYRLATAAGAPLWVSVGTCNWTGAQTLGAGVDCYVVVSGGTLDTTGLAIANSGNLMIRRYAGTLTQGTGTITQQTAAAQACVGGANYTITGPVAASIIGLNTPILMAA